MAKEINMQTSQSELKAVAKAIGQQLSGKGHKVPHSTLLHALASALGERNWHQLKSGMQAEPVAASASTTQAPSAVIEPLSTRLRFWLATAYLLNVKVPLSTPTAEQVMGFVTKTAPALEGVLKWSNWNVPATLSWTTSELDAGDFNPESKQTLGLFIGKLGELGFAIEVAYTSEKGWYLTSAGAAQMYESVTGFVEDEYALSVIQLRGSPVMANFRTDGCAFYVDFDCRAYLVQADVKELLEIIEVGYSGDTCTDSIGEYFGDKNLNETIAAGFTYLRALPSSVQEGFEVRVESEDFLRWMDQNHQQDLAKFLCDKNKDIDVCKSYDEGTAGMWDWTGPHGSASECALSTQQEAYVDAYLSLGLLEAAIADA